ncbi:MAG: VWA domain-containing protein [Rhizobiales bacterium]|nr:VWA domain-containing protein [Hyphomicrobiales bacterium]
MLRSFASLLKILPATAFLVVALAAQVFAAQPALVYVLDSSNSMWAQINGEHKIVTIRNGLNSSFGRLAGRINAGLVSFGHTQASVCSDIQTMIPVSTIDQAAFSQIVDGINPKGATPIAAALRQAVGEARDPASSGAIDVVLVFDGPDNCTGNPCAVAAELKQQNPDLRIHPIAFNETIGAEHENLSCLATTTGGNFYRATNNQEFEAALVAIEAVVFGGTPAPVATDFSPAAPHVATANPMIDTTAPAPMPALPTLRANPPVESVAEVASEADETITGSLTDVPASASLLSAGETIVTNAIPTNEVLARLEQQITKEDEPAQTGILRVSATLTTESAALQNGLVWRVFSSIPDEQGNFKVVARNEEGSPLFQLLAGDYILHVAYGRANATREITLTGGTLDEVIVLNAGGLRLSSRLAGDQPLIADLARHTVYSSEQDEFGQRKLVMPSAPEGLIIRLNAGTYHIVSQYGDANAVVRADVQIQAGKLTDAEISHSAARITLKLVTDEGGEALAGTSWSILDEDGNIVAESVGAFPSYLLAAGNYTVLARNDGQSFNRNFSVIPGQDFEVEVLTR